MIWFGKKNKAITSFAASMAQAFFKEASPKVLEQLQDPNKKMARKARQRYEAALVNIVNQVIAFKKTNKFGVYGKAKFHMEFTNQLTALGYDVSASEAINKSIMLKTP